MGRVNGTAELRGWPASYYAAPMFSRVARLFTIKTKFEAFVVIYGLGLGAVDRGIHYMEQYPGFGGLLLFAVCPLAVFMAGGKLIDAVSQER